MKIDKSFIQSKKRPAGKGSAKLRTKKNVTPLYVSPGWGITLEGSMEIVLNTAVRYRQSEVIRQAHKEANLC